MQDHHLQQPRIYHGYWLIGAAFIAQFMSVGVQNYVIGPFMLPMIEELGWSRAEYTIPRTLGQVVMAMTGFYIGTHVDRLGARRFMLIGIVILCTALYLLGLITALWQWVLLNGVVLTAGAAMIGNLVVNVTLSKWFVSFRGRAIALAAMGVSFAGVVLTPLSTWVIDQWGWRLAWQLLAVLVITLVGPVSLMMRRAPEDFGLQPDGHTAETATPKQLAKAFADYENSITRRQALRMPTFYLLVLAFGMFVITIQVMLLQTVPLMTDAGYDRTTAALMITLASVPALLSKPIWGWLIDGLDAKPLASVSAVITGLSLLMIAWGTADAITWLIYTGFAVLGFGWGGMIPLQEVIWATFFGRRYLGAVRSAALPFSLLLTAGAPLATSYYHDLVGSYTGAIVIVAVFNLISAALIYVLRKPIK